MKRSWQIILPAIAIVFVFGAAGVVGVKAQGPLSEVLQRLDTFNKRITTLRATVTMAKQNARLGDDPDITVGTAIYAKRDGKDALVRIDWKSPQESLAVIDGKYVMYRPKLAIAYTGSSKNASKNTKGNSALAFMNMSRAQLKANYDTVLLSRDATLSDGTKTFQLQLTPKSKTNYKSAELWVDADGAPRQSKVTENNDDTTTVLLTNIEANPKLSGPDFKITIPNGTKVVPS